MKKKSRVIYLFLPANLAWTPPNQLNKTKYKNPLQYRAVQIHKKEQKVIKKRIRKCVTQKEEERAGNFIIRLSTK